MTTKINIYIFIGIVFLLLTWLFVGLFRDSEFNEPELFTKYKPTFKVFFYTPIGEGSQQINDLSPEKQSEELAFQEFVIKQHKQYNSEPGGFWLLPFILIQLTLTFFTYGIYYSRYSFSYKIWQLPLHFFINFIITSFGLGFLLTFDRLIITILLILAILFANFLTVFLLTKRYLIIAPNT